VLILRERHLLETLREYARYFDRARTHQGIGQLVPAGFSTAAVRSSLGPCSVDSTTTIVERREGRDGRAK